MAITHKRELGLDAMKVLSNKFQNVHYVECASIQIRGAKAKAQSEAEADELQHMSVSIRCLMCSKYIDSPSLPMSSLGALILGCDVDQFDALGQWDRCSVKRGTVKFLGGRLSADTLCGPRSPRSPRYRKGASPILEHLEAMDVHLHFRTTSPSLQVFLMRLRRAAPKLQAFSITVYARDREMNSAKSWDMPNDLGMTLERVADLMIAEMRELQAFKIMAVLLGDKANQTSEPVRAAPHILWRTAFPGGLVLAVRNLY